jgi:hypothetical protein
LKFSVWRRIGFQSWAEEDKDEEEDKDDEEEEDEEKGALSASSFSMALVLYDNKLFLLLFLDS